jgi:hypothetical protein
MSMWGPVRNFTFALEKHNVLLWLAFTASVDKIWYIGLLVLAACKVVDPIHNCNMKSVSEVTKLTSCLKPLLQCVGPTRVSWTLVACSWSRHDWYGNDRRHLSVIRHARPLRVRICSVYTCSQWQLTQCSATFKITRHPVLCQCREFTPAVDPFLCNLVNI